MKTLDQLITESINGNSVFPDFPYVSGKGRITQLAIDLKLQKKIATLVGGDYFIDKSFMGYMAAKRSSKDNGETFIDSSILNPNKEIELSRSALNTSYKIRIDTNKNIFAFDSFNTKTKQYKGTTYFKYIPE